MPVCSILRSFCPILTCNILTHANSLGAAGSQNIQTLVILRFFAGAIGSSPLTNAGGVIADMFECVFSSISSYDNNSPIFLHSANERGLAMAIFSAAPFLGPTMGPIVGGFLGETEGWRWVEGLMAIFTGAVWIVGSLVIPETYAPVLLRRRAAKLSEMTGQVYLSQLDYDRGKQSFSQTMLTALSRPWILLIREPIVFLLSLYMAISELPFVSVDTSPAVMLTSGVLQSTEPCTCVSARSQSCIKKTVVGRKVSVLFPSSVSPSA